MPEDKDELRCFVFGLFFISFYPFDHRYAFSGTASMWERCSSWLRR
jgi:hypothetical protein